MSNAHSFLQKSLNIIPITLDKKNKITKTKKLFLSNSLYIIFTHLISAEDYAVLKNITSLMAYIS